METLYYPPETKWKDLCKRPAPGKDNLEKTVRTILDRVKHEGDKAIRHYSAKFDRVTLSEIKVSEAELEESAGLIPADLKSSIALAARNIEKFHRSQISENLPVETMPGIKCWRKDVPVEKVGLYIPGGSAPLFSTVLMLAIPAKIAGCGKIIICTPPGINGKVNPVILYCAILNGVRDIYKIGGAQAIAAMAYGTETVPGVYKIFGPGNQFVTKAKELIQTEGIAIDLPAGPSEVLVIADSQAYPEFVAADLLSQAEHGFDSQVMLLTDNKELLSPVMAELNNQLNRLPRRNIAARVLENSISIVFANLGECVEFSNMYAPEHLIINTRDAGSVAEKVVNAGSVFIGKYSCESAGDYASGTNHTLPTNGSARSFSGVSTDSFMKKLTFQEITGEGIRNIGPAIEVMAEAENLSGHKNAVNVRIKRLKDV